MECRRLHTHHKTGRPLKAYPGGDDRIRKNTDQTDPIKGERIAQAHARAGLCSRRMPSAGSPSAAFPSNGHVLDSPAIVVKPGDAIVGRRQAAARGRTGAACGAITSRRSGDDGARSSKADDDLRPVAVHHAPFVSVGRLDLTSEGLLLLTNDGELARHMELPSTGWVRRYRVRAFGRIDQSAPRQTAQRITVDGRRLWLDRGGRSTARRAAIPGFNMGLDGGPQPEMPAACWKRGLT